MWEEGCGSEGMGGLWECIDEVGDHQDMVERCGRFRGIWGITGASYGLGARGLRDAVESVVAGWKYVLNAWWMWETVKRYLGVWEYRGMWVVCGRSVHGGCIHGKHSMGIYTCICMHIYLCTCLCIFVCVMGQISAYC